MRARDDGGSEDDDVEEQQSDDAEESSSSQSSSSESDSQDEDFDAGRGRRPGRPRVNRAGSRDTHDLQGSSRRGPGRTTGRSSATPAPPSGQVTGRKRGRPPRHAPHSAPAAGRHARGSSSGVSSDGADDSDEEQSSWQGGEDSYSSEVAEGEDSWAGLGEEQEPPPVLLVTLPWSSRQQSQGAAPADNPVAPPSAPSSCITLPAKAISSAAGAYAILRAFSWQLRLSPFSLQVCVTACLAVRVLSELALVCQGRLLILAPCAT